MENKIKDGLVDLIREGQKAYCKYGNVISINNYNIIVEVEGNKIGVNNTLNEHIKIIPKINSSVTLLFVEGSIEAPMIVNYTDVENIIMNTNKKTSIIAGDVLSLNGKSVEINADNVSIKKNANDLVKIIRDLLSTLKTAKTVAGGPFIPTDINKFKLLETNIKTFIQ